MTRGPGTNACPRCGALETHWAWDAYDPEQDRDPASAAARGQLAEAVALLRDLWQYNVELPSSKAARALLARIDTPE